MSRNEEIVKKIQGGENVKENLLKLYEKNRGIIRRLCKRCGYGEELEDMEQQAYIGIHRAALTYNEEKEANFITYAGAVIKAELERYKATCGKMMKVSEKTRYIYYNYLRFVRYVEKEYNRKPTEKECARELKISPEKVREIERYARDSYTVSIDTPISGKDGSETTVGELIPEEASCVEDILEELAKDNLIVCLKEALEKLPDEIQRVARERVEGMTLEQIGEKEGIAPQKADQLFHKAIVAMRKDGSLRRAAEGIY